MNTNKYIVWDLETSGLIAPEAKILEIGVYVVPHTGQPYTKSWILDHGITIPEKITEINGITNDIIASEGKDPAVCLSEFLEILNDTDIHVTHNGMKFDIPFLAMTMAKDSEEYTSLKEKYRAYAFDTAVAFKAMKAKTSIMTDETYPQYAERIIKLRLPIKYNLKVCAEECSITTDDITLHRALGDIFITNKLYGIFNPSKTGTTSE